MIDLDVGEQNKISGGVTATAVYTSLSPDVQLGVAVVAAVAFLPAAIAYWANRVSC